MTGAAFLGVLSSDESESELLSTFLDFFLSSTLAATTTGFFLSASFYDLFFESSILTFLDGASDELTDTCFFFMKKKLFRYFDINTPKKILTFFEPI